jgi:hypothetical protein
VGAGLANSVTDTPYFLRPFATLGPLAHFEGGAGLRITRAVNVTLSGYDIAPWGTQTITSRVITASSPGKSGSASRGRPFENTHQTTGTATLTQDDGFPASLLVSPKSYLDLDVGYTRSEQYGLDTVSFGVGVHVTELLGKAHRPCIIGYTPEQTKAAFTVPIRFVCIGHLRDTAHDHLRSQAELFPRPSIGDMVKIW